MANPTWFDEYSYLNSKLNQLQNAGYTEYSTITQVKTAIEAAGMTTYEHFQQYSLSERTSPNDYFNTNEYLAAKAVQLNTAQSVTTWTAEKVALAFQNAGYTNAYEHFVAFGFDEGVNPSNSFDISEYLADKLAALQADSATATEWADKTVDDVQAALQSAGYDPISHYLAAGATEGLAATEVPAAEQVEDDTTSGTAGQTFTLTTSIDTLNGTTGNDTFVGDAGTTSAADQVVGGAGTDTLKLYGTNTVAPTYSGIENIELIGRNATAFDTSSKSDVKSVTVDGAVTGASTITVAAGQSVTLSNSNIGTNVATTAANTSLAVTLNKLGVAGTAATVDFAGAALATVDLAVAGNSVIVLTNDEKLATLNISGAGNVTIDADAGGAAAGTLLTTVNAASATGNLSIQLEDDTSAKDVTVTGGAGNDTANFGAAFTKADKFDGGAGTDTLELTQASVTTVEGYTAAADIAAVKANLANIEVLKVTDALTGSIDASRFDSVNQFVLNAGYGIAAGTTTHTISKVTSGVTLTINDAAVDPNDTLAVEIIDATLAGNNSDVLNVVLNDAAAGGASDIGIINAVGVDILNIEAKSLTAAGAAGTTTSYVLDIANTSTALDKVVVTGNIGINLSNVALVNSIAEIDASGMTVAKKTDAGLTASVATGGTNGVKITGSGGVDVLTGGDAADIIIGGAGADTITGGAGNDQLTGGADSDTFVFAASAANNGKDTITDFKAGAVADGGDVFDFGTNALGTTTVSAAQLAITSGSANQAIADDNVYQITLNTAIASKDFGAADFAELFGAATGQFSTTVAGVGVEGFVLVKGTDTTHVYFVDSDLTGSGAATTLDAAAVALVGVVTVDGTLTTANFA